jgi:hypothetical protein
MFWTMKLLSEECTAQLVRRLFIMIFPVVDIIKIQEH